MVAWRRKCEPCIGRERSARQSFLSASVVAWRSLRALGIRSSSARNERMDFISCPPPPTPPHRFAGGGARRGSSCRNFHQARECRRYAAGAGGASVRCVPSQVGFLPLRLQTQKAISPAAAALYSTGENSDPLCEPSQNGCFLERPQAHHQ